MCNRRRGGEKEYKAYWSSFLCLSLDQCGAPIYIVHSGSPKSKHIQALDLRWVHLVVYNHRRIDVSDLHCRICVWSPGDVWEMVMVINEEGERIERPGISNAPPISGKVLPFTPSTNSTLYFELTPQPVFFYCMCLEPVLKAKFILAKSVLATWTIMMVLPVGSQCQGPDGDTRLRVAHCSILEGERCLACKEDIELEQEFQERRR